MQRSVVSRGKLITFDDGDRTNAQAITCLEKKAAEGNNFAADLLANYRKWRRLSEKQWSWVHFLIQPKKEEPQPNSLKMPRTIELITKVDLQWPKLRVNLLGQDIVIKKCRRGVGLLIDDEWVGYLDGALKRELTQEEKAVLLLVELDPVGVATLHGKKTGSCCFCGRHLETTESVTAGYGPVCAEKWGLPWGDVPDTTLIDQVRKLVQDQFPSLIDRLEA